MTEKKKNARTALLIVALIVLFLVATNPGLPEFRDWFQIQAANAVKQQAGNNDVGEFFGAIAQGAARIAVDSDYHRSNLLVCSLYQSKDGSGKVVHAYLGIARTFIKIR